MIGRITIKMGDITMEDVDVIVNAANTALSGSGGVDGAIHRAAGPSVLEECRRIGSCKTGEAVITGAGVLNARKIIHTPRPVWHGGSEGEEDLLRNCYRSSFRLAEKNGFRTIAFPAISTGIYGYPIEKAARIALEEGLNYLNTFDEIIYVCFSQKAFEAYQKIYKELQ